MLSKTSSKINQALPRYNAFRPRAHTVTSRASGNSSSSSSSSADRIITSRQAPGTFASRKASTYTFDFQSTMTSFPLNNTQEAPVLPSYLVDTYTWAYLSEQTMPFLDSHLVVSGILWGNANKLMSAAIQEIQPGQRVLQPACVYGTFSRQLADQVGPQGHLVVSDVATIQLKRLYPKVADLPHVTLALADARKPVGGPFDAVCCFFLLHEVPDDVKREIVTSLFASLRPGGKLVFVDYHKPASLHPLKGVMSVVFDTLEPFAKSLYDNEISSFCPNPEAYEWQKETYFGGLYQKVVATRK